MSKQNQMVAVKLVDVDTKHWRLETKKGDLIGQITQEGSRFLIQFANQRPTHHKSLSEATEALLLQYNLHQH